MGIRFNRDSKRATNGPMIFFSDPSAEIDLQDEIRGAIDSRLSFYAYRRPGDMMVSFGSSETIAEGIGVPGFVIAPFHPSATAVTIPWKPTCDCKRPYAENATFPQKSTTFDEYALEIRKIKELLGNNPDTKVVASRVACINGNIDVAATFSRLCREYPSAFVFAFATPVTGCWIGASPELLLCGTAGKLETMALAGTRECGKEMEWDVKNTIEQRIVSGYISDCLESNGITPLLGKTFSRPAGGIEHICTPISADIPSDFNADRLRGLLKDLSPTPAVCGYPKDLALDTISRLELHDRGCYGGFCGPYSGPTDFSFYVNLRCAAIESTRYAMFAGGGITSRSSENEEWTETELKMKTLGCALADDREIKNI